MIAAVSAILGVTGALLSLAFALWRTERDRGNQKARGDALDVNLTGLATQLADMTNQRNEERDRANRLDDLCASIMANVAAGPVSGSAQRLLEAIAAARANRGDSAPAVHPTEAAAEPRAGDTDLLRPGE